MLSKFQKSQSAQKSHSLGANTSNAAQNKREKGKTDSSIIGLMLQEFFILCLCKGMVLKHSDSIISIPSGLPIPISSNHSTDFNINNEIRALVSIHNIGDFKVSIRGNSNIPSLL